MSKNRKRKGLTLVEFLVVVGILAVIMSLLVPAVLRVRAAALRTQSSNHLRQINLAAIGFGSDTNGFFPDVRGYNPNIKNVYNFSFFICLFPYLEQGRVDEMFMDSFRKGNADSSWVVPVLISPEDPSIESKQGVASYSPNGQFFWDSPHLNKILDGTSNTIFFAEKMPFKCGGNTIYYMESEQQTFPPNPYGLVRFRRSSFADREMGDIVPLSRGFPVISTGSTAGLTFQTNPSRSDCDPRLAQSPNPSGLLVGMADGSVRTLGKAMAENAYWALVTPNGGEIKTND